MVMPQKSRNPENPVQYVRRAIGLSQAEFGAALGLSRSLLAKLESRQGGYEQPSDRVRAKIATEFGAILQPEGAAVPALDMEDQPYTLRSFQNHRQRSLAPSSQMFPPEAIGIAMTWIASTARLAGFSGAFNDGIGKAIKWFATFPGLGEALEKEIPEELSTNQKIAATWLLQYFTMPRLISSLRLFSGYTQTGERFFKISTSGQDAKSPSASSSGSAPVGLHAKSPNERCPEK